MKNFIKKALKFIKKICFSLVVFENEMIVKITW